MNKNYTQLNQNSVKYCEFTPIYTHSACNDSIWFLKGPMCINSSMCNECYRGPSQQQLLKVIIPENPFLSRKKYE